MRDERGDVRSVTRASGALRFAFFVSAALGIALTLSACVTGAVDPVATPTSSRPTPTPTPTPTADPELVPGGTAGQNRPYLEFVVNRLLETTPQPASLAIVDTLVAAGFDRAAMQVTADTTRVGDPADSILFSVLIDGQCLLGQVAQGTLQTELADVLGSGRCLVGRTVSLD